MVSAVVAGLGAGAGAAGAALDVFTFCSNESSGAAVVPPFKKRVESKAKIAMMQGNVVRNDILEDKKKVISMSNGMATAAAGATNGIKR